MPVGIFDSGLGGLTVYDAVSKELPEISFCYFGDNRNAPYGTRSQDEIFRLTCNAIECLWESGCELVILACNTASAAALRRIQEEWLPSNKRVLGVSVPMIEKLTERDWGQNSPPQRVKVERIALFATPATVASRAFQRELAFRAIGVDVESQACAGLVDAIEDGDFLLAEAIARGTSKLCCAKCRCPRRLFSDAHTILLSSTCFATPLAIYRFTINRSLSPTAWPIICHGTRASEITPDRRDS